jgi:hypothetical protein
MAIVFIIDGIIAIVITITVAAAAVVDIITVIAPAFALPLLPMPPSTFMDGAPLPRKHLGLFMEKNISFSLPLLSYDGSLLSVVSLLPPMPSLPPLSCHRCHGHHLHH